MKKIASLKKIVGLKKVVRSKKKVRLKKMLKIVEDRLKKEIDLKEIGPKSKKSDERPKLYRAYRE